MKHPDTDKEYVIIGKLGKPYGIKGWLKVLSFTDPKENLFQYIPWALNESGQWKSITVEDGKHHGNGLIVKLAGLNTPEEARLFTGKSIAVPRSTLPALQNNEFYWSDLEGLTVVDDDTDQILGTISYLMETGSNDVMIVKGEKELAIPYLPGSVVKKVDLANKIIRVHWDLR